MTSNYPGIHDIGLAIDRSHWLFLGCSTLTRNSTCHRAATGSKDSIYDDDEGVEAGDPESLLCMHDINSIYSWLTTRRLLVNMGRVSAMVNTAAGIPCMFAP